jgi:predicted transcriptional regulator
MDNDLLSLTSDIVSAHVSNNSVSSADLPTLISSVHAALAKASEPVVEEGPKVEPAVPIRSSVKHDYIVCLEDGAKLKMLKRYLMTNFKMSPEDYRAKWGLPRDYPMVAPAYAETRRALAQKIGLGRKKAVEVIEPVAKAVRKTAKKAVAAVEAAVTHEPKKRGRPAKAATPDVEVAEA